MPPVVLLVAGLGLVGIGGALLVTTTLTFASFWVSTLIFTGISTALGGVSAILQKQALQRALNNEITGRQVTARQAAAPRRIVYGILVRIGGVITYIDARGTDNEFLDLVITLTGREINNIGSMYFDGVAVGIDGSGNGTGKYAGLVHIEKNLGTATQAAFPGLVADSGGKWSAAHQQKGCAGVYVRLTYDGEVFPRGVPNITFDVGGAKVFDPRGPTTAVSENPALCLADYLTDTDFGFGVDYATRIDETELIAAANICEEQVDLDPSGTEDRYTVNGTFTTDQQPFSVINAMRAAMAGYITDVGGKWKILAGAWRAPTVTLGLADLRGSIALTSNQARRDSFNSVKGTYTNAAHKWQPTDFPIVTNPTYVTEDGGRKIYMDIDLPFTVSSPTAQRIAKIELERSRLQRIVKLPCKMTAYQLQPGDTVTLNLAPVGLTAAVYEVLEVNLVVERLAKVPALGVDLTLRASASTVFDWDEAIDEQDDPAPPTTSLPDPTSVPTPTGLAVAWEDAANPDLINTIRAHLTWTAVPDVMVKKGGGTLEIEYKASASGTWIAIKPLPGHHTELDVGGIFAEGTDYDFRIRARNIYGVVGLYQTITDQTATGTESGIGAMGTTSPTHGQNVLRNWNFEDDLELFWGALAGANFSIETNAANAHSGNKHGLQTVQAKGVFPVDHKGNFMFFPVADGDIIQFKGWGFPVGSGAACNMQILVFDKDKVFKRAVTSPSFTEDVWGTFTDTTTIDQSNDEFYVLPQFRQAAGTSHDFRFDDAKLRILRPADQITEDGERKWNRSAHNSYRPLTNALTASGSIVSIAAQTMRIGGVDKSVSPGSIDSLSIDTLYFIYFDQIDIDTATPWSVTFVATTTKETALADDGRFFVGSIRTPASGAADTVGNNDGGSGVQWGIQREHAPLIAEFAGDGSTTNEDNGIDNDWGTFGEKDVTGIGIETLSGTYKLKTFSPGGNLLSRKTLRIRVKYRLTAQVIAGTPTVTASIAFGSFTDSVSQSSFGTDDTGILTVTQTIGAFDIDALELLTTATYTGTDGADRASGTVAIYECKVVEEV